MPVTLTCPSCRSPVEVADAARGRTISCGVCRAELSVPVAPVLPARAATRAAPVARAIPVAKPQAAAQPVPEVGTDRRPRNRRDEGDREGRPGRRSEGGGQALVVGLLAGGLLLGLIASGVALAYFLWPTGPERVEDGGAAPLGPPAVTPRNDDRNDDPNPPHAVEPPAPAAGGRSSWPQMIVDGDAKFTAQMPPPAGVRSQSVVVGGEQLRSRRYEANEGLVRYRIQYFDVPDALRLTPAEFVKESYPGGDPEVVGGPTAATIGQTPAVELVVRIIDDRETVRAAKVGPRMYLVSAAYNPDEVKNRPGSDPEAKAKVFFDSVSITFDPSTPAPPARGRPMLPPRPGLPPDAPRELTYVTRIDGFATAVALPGRGEVLTFGVRTLDSPVTGVVRRYATPKWKPLRQVVLPGAVLHAVADEKSGRLYVGTATRIDRGIDVGASEWLTATGEVQVFDLKEVLADRPQNDPLKPLATARFPDVGSGHRIAGLDLEPGGRFVYAVTVAKQPASKPPRTRAWRLTAADLTPAGEAIELPQPVRAVRLSPDGRHLFAAEFGYGTFGEPQYGTTGATRLHMIDAVGWRAVRAVPIPGTVATLAFVGDAKAAAVLARGSGPARLYTVDADGTTADVTATAGLRVPGAWYVKLAPGGRVILSGRDGALEAGTEVLTLGASGATSLDYTVGSPGGPVTVVADGRLLLYGTGAVLELLTK